MKKINLNKRTLRVLTPAEEALVAGGTDSSGLDMDWGGGGGGGDGGDGGGGGGGGGGDFGGGGGGGGGGPKVPKGTFDSECRCPTDVCPPTQENKNPKCPKGTGD